MTQSIKAAYNQAAAEYRRQYQLIPARVDDVDLALSYINVQRPVVLEIGCAYGREAQYILTKTPYYLGIDISSAYINMARAENSAGNFEVADVLRYEFPDGLDVIFAFASLLHNPKEDLQVVLDRAAAALNPGGVLFISLKRHDQYETDVLDDGYSKRRYYYYTRATVLDATPDTMSEVYYQEQSRQEEWFTMILQKK
jgi:SAM-dependent methyltransferase